MAEKLTPAKVEEAVKHYENIQSGKTPILKTDKEKTTEHITDLHKHLKKKDNKTFPLMIIKYEDLVFDTEKIFIKILEFIHKLTRSKFVRP